jgi:hypothetical protein
MAAGTTTYDVHIIYHVMTEISREPKSQVSVERIQQCHDQMQLDLNAQNADLTKVPTTGKYSQFRSTIASLNVRLMPQSAQQKLVSGVHIRYVDASDVYANDGPVGYIREFWKRSPQVPQYLNFYIYSDRIASATGSEGFAYVGNTTMCCAHRTVGNASQYPSQRGVPTHEMLHSLSLEHTFGALSGVACFQQKGITDVPRARYTNFPNDPPQRYTQPCKQVAGSSGGQWQGWCTNADVDVGLYGGRITRSCNTAAGTASSDAAAENFFNFMDYSQHRCMISAAQRLQVRTYLSQNLAKYRGSAVTAIAPAPTPAPTPTAPTPAPTPTAPTPTPTPAPTPSAPTPTPAPIRYLQPYVVFNETTQRYLGADASTRSGVWVPAIDDPRVVTVTVKQSAIVYTEGDALLEFSFMEVLQFSTGAALTEEVVGSGSPMKWVPAATTATVDANAFLSGSVLTTLSAATSASAAGAAVAGGGTMYMQTALRLSNFERTNFLGDVGGYAMLRATNSSQRLQFRAAPPVLPVAFPRALRDYTPFRVAAQELAVAVNTNYYLSMPETGRYLSVASAQWVDDRSQATVLRLRFPSSSSSPQLTLRCNDSVQMLTAVSGSSSVSGGIRVQASNESLAVSSDTELSSNWIMESAAPGVNVHLNLPFRLRARDIGAVYLGSTAAAAAAAVVSVSASNSATLLRWEPATPLGLPVAEQFATPVPSAWTAEQVSSAVVGSGGAAADVMYDSSNVRLVAALGSLLYLGIHPCGMGMSADSSTLTAMYLVPAPAAVGAGGSVFGAGIVSNPRVRIRVRTSDQPDTDQWLIRHGVLKSLWLSQSATEASTFELAPILPTATTAATMQVVWRGDGSSQQPAVVEWLSLPGQGGSPLFFSTDYRQRVEFKMLLLQPSSGSGQQQQQQVMLSDSVTPLRYGEDVIMVFGGNRTFTQSPLYPGRLGWQLFANDAELSKAEPIAFRAMGPESDPNRTGPVLVSHQVRWFVAKYGSYLNEQAWFVYNAAEATEIRFTSSSSSGSSGSNRYSVSSASTGSGAHLGFDAKFQLATFTNLQPDRWLSNVQLQIPPVGLSLSGALQPQPAGTVLGRQLQGVVLQWRTPYNVIRVGANVKDDLQLGSSLGRGVQWTPMGVGHPFDLVPVTGAGAAAAAADVSHMSLVRLSHGYTEAELWFSTAASSQQQQQLEWTSTPGQGAVFRVELQDVNRSSSSSTSVVVAMSTSRLRLRLMTWVSASTTSAAAGWQETSNFLTAAATQYHEAVVGTDACYMFQIRSLRNSQASQSLEEVAQGRVTRLGQRLRPHPMVEWTLRRQAAERLVNEQDAAAASAAAAPLVEAAVGDKQVELQRELRVRALAGEMPLDSIAIRYNDYYRVVDVTTGRELKSVDFLGLQWLLPDEQTTNRGEMLTLTREDAEGVIRQGDNCWMAGDSGATKLFAAGTALGNPMYLVSSATGNKLMVEGERPGEPITAATRLRFRFAFPDPRLPTNLFVGYSPLNRQAILNTDDSFRFSLRLRDDDDFALVQPPINGALSVELRGVVSLVDYESAETDADRLRLSAGGGRDMHWALPGLEAPMTLFDSKVDREGTLENGERVFLAHATSLQQAQLAATSSATAELSLSAPAGSGLAFTIEVDPSLGVARNATIQQGHLVRLRTDDSRYLGRDSATGKAVLLSGPGDGRYRFQIVGSSALPSPTPDLVQSTGLNNGGSSGGGGGGGGGGSGSGSGSSSSSGGAMIGGIVAGILVAVGVGVGLYFWMRRRRQQQALPGADSATAVVAEPTRKRSVSRPAALRGRPKRVATAANAATASSSSVDGGGIVGGKRAVNSNNKRRSNNNNSKKKSGKRKSRKAGEKKMRTTSVKVVAPKMPSTDL